MPWIPENTLLERLAQRPLTAEDLANELIGLSKEPLSADSAARRLRRMASSNKSWSSPPVWRRPVDSRWELTPLVLVGAAGSSRINAAVYDIYGRAHAGISHRRSEFLEDPADAEQMAPVAILRAVAVEMNRALALLDERQMANVSAVAIAVPFGLSTPVPGKIVDADEPRSAKDLVLEFMERDETRSAPSLPKNLPWVECSDVAGEAVFEHRHLARSAGRERMLVLKASRNLRASVLLDGQPWPSNRGDVSDLGELRYIPDPNSDEPTFAYQSDEHGGRPPTLQSLIRLQALYVAATGGTAASFESAFRSAQAYSDAAKFDEVFRPLLNDESSQSRVAQKAFYDVGYAIGCCLDAPLTLLGTSTVIVTGFLSRAPQLRQGIEAACRRYKQHLQVEVVLGSGIEAEEKGLVSDQDEGKLPVPSERPMAPNDLPHQFRVSAGTAMLTFERHAAALVPGADADPETA